MPQIIPPKTWLELKDLKTVIPKITRQQLRSPISNFIYQTYIHFLPKSFVSFHIKLRIGPHQIRLLKNDFPYDFVLQKLPNVKQYCLWSLQGELDIPTIEKVIQQYYPKCDYFWFVNELKYKSIPGIWHCHVFINHQ